MESDHEFDQQLRDAILAEPVDTSALDARIRSHTRSVGRGKWIAAIGIAALLALAIGGYFWFPKRSEIVCSDAQRDHRIEIVESSPRKWLTQPQAIQALAAKQSVPLPQPAGYNLQRGKLCRLGGHVFLHLVYSDGSHEVSLFLRDRGPSPTRGDLIDANFALVEGPRLTAVAVATTGALELARFAASGSPQS